MRKETLMTRMAPHIRQQAMSTAAPSIIRAALVAYVAQAITRKELDAIQRARAEAAALDEYGQALAGQWEHFAAGIIYNAEATL